MNNRDLVLKAVTELFVKRDVTAIDRYWGSPYIQHNPLIPNGREHLAEFVKSLGPHFKYEPGKVKISSRDPHTQEKRKRRWRKVQITTTALSENRRASSIK